jgi:hypothetical protein
LLMWTGRKRKGNGIVSSLQIQTPLRSAESFVCVTEKGKDKAQ